MNLFISDNFIDTVEQKVNVLQLIRQVAEDDELLDLEVLSELAKIFDYVSTTAMEEAIRDGEFEDLAIREDVLYVGGVTLKDLFEALYPGDYTAVINSLVSSIVSATEPTLRLDHNGVPVVREEVQQTIDFSNLAHVEDLPPVTVGLGEARNMSISSPVPANHVVTAVDGNEMSVRPVEVQPFPGDSEVEEVLRSEMAVLNSQTILGELSINGCKVSTRMPAGKNGVLFNVAELYFAVYALKHNHDYLDQLVIEHRMCIDPEDILINRGIYLSAYALAKLHPRLCHLIEWIPLVMLVVTKYKEAPLKDAAFDLLGNQEG